MNEFDKEIKLLNKQCLYYDSMDKYNHDCEIAKLCGIREPEKPNIKNPGLFIMEVKENNITVSSHQFGNIISFKLYNTEL